MPRVSRRFAVSALAAAGIGTACRLNSAGTDPESALDQLSERYVRCALQLAQHQPSLVEAWLGPQNWRPGPRVPVAQVRVEIEDAFADPALLARDHSPAERVVYLRQQLDALRVAARRLSGESVAFADEARAALGSDVGDFVERLSTHHTPGGSSEIERAHATLAERLPGRGSIHDRYAAFRRRHALSPDDVRRALPAALDACRRNVRQRIELPDSEHVDWESMPVAGVEARATYSGNFRSRVQMDASRRLDIVHLLWLVAHEAYPGHHVQHVLADRDRVLARRWHERALFPTFGRHLLCAEGAAEAGAALLMQQSEFQEACHAVAHAVGRPATDVTTLVAVHDAVRALDVAIPAIARSYLDGEISNDAAAVRLATEAFVLDPQPLLFSIERQRTRILAYPLGRRLVWSELADTPARARWERLATIATALIMA